MQNRLLSGATIAVMAFASLAPSVGAQEQESSQDDRRLNIVTITAQRVEQNLQVVPISVTAIDGDALDARQIDSFDQLQYIAPGLSFNAGLNARQSASTIRGIGTSLFNIGIEGSVAVAVDGVVLGREGAGIFDFSDVERVEVLRGPQGTLFGKNASAGVISIVTKQPTDEFAAEFDASYGSFNETSVSAAISGPITDGVKGRLSGYNNTRDGYITNINPAAPQSDVNERNEFGVRGKLKFDSSDTFDLTLGADYAKRDQSAGALTLRSVSSPGPGTGLLGFGVQVIGPVSASVGIKPGPDNKQIASNGTFESEMESYGVYAEANKRFGDFDLVSLTSIREWKSFDNNDADLIPLPFLAVNNADLEQNQFSQEFRLVSPRDQALTYTVGAYYFHQEIDQTNTQSGTAGLNLLRALAPGLLLGTDLVSTVEETNMALFGQAEYALTDKLTTIGGLRVLNSDISASLSRSITPGAVGPFAGQSITASPLAGDTDDTAVVWRLGLQYFINDDVNVFTTVSRGYKSAGIVSGLTINATQAGGTALPMVEPEVPVQIEAGIRAVSMDGRLVTNFTAFRSEIEDFQAQALVPGPSGTSIFSVTNAGSVETYGLEGDITLLPVDGLTLSTSFAYTHATFQDFPDAPCYALQTVGPNGCIDTNADGRGEFQNLNGKDLAQSPEWIINALARYDFALTQNLDAFVQVGAQYRGDAISSNTNDPNTVLDAYTLVDASLGVKFWDGRGALSIFGRNLTDETFVEAIVGQAFDTGGYAQFQSFESEQSFGVKLSLDY
jgi:iron complex outermembrane recepter protein